MNIASSLNDTYVPYTYVMLDSLYRNDPGKEIHVFLLQDHLKEEGRTLLTDQAYRHGGQVTFLDVDPSLFDQRMLDRGGWSVETLYRLALFDLLPEDIDRILYLDGDMIINRDISPLYTKDFGGKHLLVTHDMTMNPAAADSEAFGKLHSDHFNQIIRENQYFNAGMILFDCPYMRAHYHLGDYLDRARALDWEVYAPDQDLLNDLHREETAFVDARDYDLFACNAFVYGLDYEGVRDLTPIIHFVGEKPWNAGDHIPYELELLWWDYAEKTPFLEDFCRNFLTGLVSDSSFYRKLLAIEKEDRENRGKLSGLMKTLKKLYSRLTGDKRETAGRISDLEKRKEENTMTPARGSASGQGPSPEADLCPSPAWDFLPLKEVSSLLDGGLPQPASLDLIRAFIRDGREEAYIRKAIDQRNETIRDLDQAVSSIRKLVKALD